MAERIMAVLPGHQVAFLFDFPDSLNEVAAFAFLDEEEQPEEEDMGGESHRDTSDLDKEGHCNALCTEEENRTGIVTLLVGAAFGSQSVSASNPEFSTEVPAVTIWQHLQLDLARVLFWGSALLALVSLFILVALANTVCVCNPASGSAGS